MPVRGALVVALIGVIANANAARAASTDGSVYLFSVDANTFRSDGEAAWFDDLNRVDPGVELSGEHRVKQVSPLIDYIMSVQGSGRYYQSFEGPAEAGACYDTALQVTFDPPGWFDEVERTWTGLRKCAPAAPDKDDPIATDCETNVCPPHSPIVLALEGRFEFTDLAGGVRFDINADGTRDRVAWPRDGSVAFLFFDRNGNGLVDDGGELFGDHTRLRSGATALNGFEALSEFDSTGDGAVSPDDLQWARLSLWQDFDHDGLATHNEISALGAHGIVSLGLDYRWTGRHDQHGNLLRWRSKLTLSADAQPGPRAYYDVYLLTRLE